MCYVLYKNFIFIFLLNQAQGVWTIILSPLYRRKNWGLERISYFLLGHKAGKYQRKDINPGLFDSQNCILNN